jgi:hypothetical protein
MKIEGMDEDRKALIIETVGELLGEAAGAEPNWEAVMEIFNGL